LGESGAIDLQRAIQIVEVGISSKGRHGDLIGFRVGDAAGCLTFAKRVGQQDFLFSILPKPTRPDSWTGKAPLPGGDFPFQGFDALVNQLQARYRALDPNVISRLARAYGTLVPEILRGREAENLSGSRARAIRRIGDAVRRTADRD
jgi:hypothetical protein